MLKIQNLSKSYGEKKVLKDLSLYIAPGEIYGLIGVNGTGKTTIINLISQLIKADSGNIQINDQPVSKITKRFIGIAPQENSLYKTLSCEENLDFFAKIYGLDRKARQQQITGSLKFVNLMDVAKNSVETLSSEMQRRLNIAVALVHQPKLVILDEPTKGLNVEARYEIWELIQQLRDQGMTILLTTHFLEEAEYLCDKIGILKNGRVQAEGSLVELKGLIPAQEIIVVQTSDEKQAIARAVRCGFTPRRYGKDLAFWLPEHLELKEVISRFDGVPLDAIARQPVRLEHIYMEIMQSKS